MMRGCGMVISFRVYAIGRLDRFTFSLETVFLAVLQTLRELSHVL